MGNLFDEALGSVYRKDVGTLEKLVERGLRIDSVDEDGRTLLMHAILDEQSDPNVIEAILKLGASVNVADTGQRWTALHFAAQTGRVEVADVLLRNGASVDTLDAFGNSPLWRAVMSSVPNIQMIEQLIKAGADPMQPNSRGVSAVDVAARRGLTDVHHALLGQ